MPSRLSELRRHAVGRSLFPATSLQAAIDRLGFIQADPIRAPARAQDLTLRHRVSGYRAGDLERLYPELAVEEDVFVAYGFVSRPLYHQLHPRGVRPAWTRRNRELAARLLEFVQQRGAVHPREVDRHFTPGTVRNYWGGTSSATTHLLEAMHYRGLLRVVRRDKGIRIYGPRTSEAIEGNPEQRLDALVEVAVNKYGPLPAPSLSNLVSRLRWTVPQWRGKLRDAARRARQRLAHARVAGTEWYWFEDGRVARDAEEDRVRFLAPFDPIVWDRRRFELLWGWEYRFEAYTPVRKRKLGYYALPLLWRDRIIGWANLALREDNLVAGFGYTAGRPPRDRVFRRELDAEVERMRSFLQS